MNPTTPSVLYRLAVVFAAAALFAFTACTNDPSAPEQAGIRSATSAARATSTTDMSVTSTSPDSATQDTTLDVVVNGSGFVSGTTASWALAGISDSTQVKTNSTRYVSSRQLVANITISSSAAVGKWDVVVTATGKKGGIGTELFAIKTRGNVDTHSRVRYTVMNQVDVGGVATPAGITGDGRLANGSIAGTSDSQYQGDFCGVEGVLANGPRESGNLSYDPDGGSTNFCGAPRYMVFSLDAVPTNLAPLSRVFGIWALGVGESVNKGQGFGVELPNCGVLMFSSQYGVDDLRVSRVDAGTGPRQWLIQSQGSHMAACVNLVKKGPTAYAPTGKKYFLPFVISVTEVPYPYPTYP